MGRWLAAFLAAAVASASVLLAVYGTWLIVDPHEGIHFEVALPALLLAAAGAAAAVRLWRASR
ncbi:MAG TPA: hypothetical protein VNJ46_03375 [Gaiellaceae bacterium]|nr:hypothetical protein [Gaiellaceae bacterium]